MRIRVTDNDLANQKADLAACFAYENDTEPRGVEDRGLRKALAARMKAEGFDGAVGTRVHWTEDAGHGATRFVVIGLGPERPTPGESVRVGSARAAREAATISARRLSLRLPPVASGRASVEARAAAEGVLLGAYQFDRHLTDPTRRKTRLEAVELSANGATKPVRDAVRRGGVGARAVCLARDLVNEGPSRMTPSALARIATREGRTRGVQVRSMGPAELRKSGMSALLAVARGSAEAPRVVHMSYKPARGKADEKIVIVGKGVTFDSGGLNLKPAESMRDMKADMAGAAAVLAAMTALKDLGCRAEVHGLLGLVENMAGANAYKPGDILDTLSGKTVEVGNTDAEGRLVLCDLLAYTAKKMKPTQVVDVATLTGAVVVALGLRATGLFTRHDALGERLMRAGLDAGEKVWPMPLYEEYLPLLQKGPADLCSVAGRWGGAITAALFLGEFLPRDLPWAHLDIAGPAFAESEVPESPAGGTGAGVLTLLHWLESV